MWFINCIVKLWMEEDVFLIFLFRYVISKFINFIEFGILSKDSLDIVVRDK